jgi:predicted DNA-binding protein (MmcQ/YjbR family)
MNIEEFRDYCLSKKFVTEELPFGPETLVFKVQGKLFALTNIDDFSSINLKCEPDKIVALRERYSDIQPGYHMNKNHWNTVRVNSALSDSIVYGLVDYSYDLVVKGLPKKIQSLF